MNTAAIRRRLKRLEARLPAREEPKTVAERFTASLRTKYLQDYEPDDPPKPFDREAGLERMRRILIERGQDTDAPYQQ